MIVFLTIGVSCVLMLEIIYTMVSPTLIFMPTLLLALTLPLLALIHLFLDLILPFDSYHGLNHAPLSDFIDFKPFMRGIHTIITKCSLIDQILR